jgi:hypothetical protein
VASDLLTPQKQSAIDALHLRGFPCLENSNYVQTIWFNLVIAYVFAGELLMIVKKTHTNPKDMVLQMGITHFCNMHKSLESIIFLSLLVSASLNCKELDVTQTRVVWTE